MNAGNARTKLLAQHELLRSHIATCTRLGALYRAGELVELELDAALERLRGDFSEHNQTETTVVRTLLHGSSTWGSLLIDRMLEEHVSEHAAFWELLSQPCAEIVTRIDELAEDLEAHMAAEERTFLSPITLRDDVIQARTRET